MKKGEVATARTFSTENRATLHRLAWVCPNCKREHEERNADNWESFGSGTVAHASVQCADCGAEFDIEMDGTADWEADEFKFTMTAEPVAEAKP